MISPLSALCTINNNRECYNHYKVNTFFIEIFLYYWKLKPNKGSLKWLLRKMQKFGWFCILMLTLRGKRGNWRQFPPWRRSWNIDRLKKNWRLSGPLKHPSRWTETIHIGPALKIISWPWSHGIWHLTPKQAQLFYSVKIILFGGKNQAY